MSDIRRTSTTDVPVLTEVVELGSPAAAMAGGELSLQDRKELEEQLRQRILASIDPYLASFLDEPLRVRLEDHLRRALAALTSQVKADIDMLVQDAVTRAVRQALDSTRVPPAGR